MTSLGKAAVHLLTVCCFLVFTSGCAVSHPVVKRRAVETAAAPAAAMEIPYRVADKVYYPVNVTEGYTEEGVASWYGPGFNGQLTSNKEVYNMESLTAAHKTLPFNTRIQIVNLDNGLEAAVRINDRGPFVEDRILDLSYGAAKKLGVIKRGTARVRFTVVGVPAAARGAEQAFSRPKYSVQIGVFKDSGYAKRLQSKIKSSYIQSFARDGETLYRVAVGSYGDFAGALARLDQLQAAGFAKAFIVAD